MTSMVDHSQNMGSHVDAMEQHHAELGGGIGQLYAALEQAQQLMQTLTEAYTALSGTHAGMQQTVDGAKQTAASLQEGAQQAQ